MERFERSPKLSSREQLKLLHQSSTREEFWETAETLLTTQGREVVISHISPGLGMHKKGALSLPIRSETGDADLLLYRSPWWDEENSPLEKPRKGEKMTMTVGHEQVELDRAQFELVKNSKPKFSGIKLVKYTSLRSLASSEIRNLGSALITTIRDTETGEPTPSIVSRDKDWSFGLFGSLRRSVSFGEAMVYGLSYPDEEDGSYLSVYGAHERVLIRDDGYARFISLDLNGPRNIETFENYLEQVRPFLSEAKIRIEMPRAS